MGDRANFGFKQEHGTIFLYGHWAGNNMMANLAYALEKAEPRWSDESYGTRIAISQLINSGWDSEYGWGLSVNYITDNEHSIPVVDFNTKTVSLWDEGVLRGVLEGESGEPKFTMGFEAFVKKFSKEFAIQ